MGNQLQHYVPRFMLRRFGKGKKEHVHVLDKQSGHRFSFSASRKAVISVAAEYGMYDFDFMGEPVTIEPGLADLETKAAGYVRRIADAKRFDLGDPMERATLACFIAVQMIRTRAVLETQADMMSRMKTWLEADGAPEGFFDPDPHVGSGENADKALLAKLICNAPRDFAPLLVEKDWVLLQTDRRHPFLMGDHPVAMFNEVDRGLRGNLGLKVEGIQIYFPLGPTLALGIWCPTLQQTLLDFIGRLDALSETQPHVATQHAGEWQQAIETVEAIRRGTPLSYRPENVEHFNSLQVIHAERFVFSSDVDFSLVESMVQQDSTLRRGPRMAEATGKF